MVELHVFVHGITGFDNLAPNLEEVVSKAQSCEKLKVEAEKCLAQSERFSNEKAEFESAIYAKARFLGVSNSKKAKLRELRDRLSKQESSGKLLEEESTEKTEIYGNDDEKSEDEPAKDLIGTSKNVLASRSRGRKRK
ncbi:unnamed protein product [Ilex paraguariensis]|uniref:Uncharacterized protein n=1 Tax=Ilex paraguariensis TaxID=185542 RepID=A0ABC8TJF3_9AQUA